ncbi:hypothetical protein GCM10022393_25650 [Aquimarina addita]|uniref:T9SS C-terminal target domain-containing protein n=1 Tax=Aquimarina addita TaxID=870485 RepID=A0ABP6UL94_9FLAO
MKRKQLLFKITIPFLLGICGIINAQSIVSHDFNDGKLGPFESTNLNRMTFKDGALECTWKPSDYTGTGTSSKKTEFRADDNAYEFRQEFWTGFKVKVHDDVFATNTNNDMSFMQIWGFDETGANHYAMLKFDGRNGGALTWYHRNGGGSAGKSNFLVYPGFPRNRFVDIIIHVKLSSNGGIVQIWADGDLKLDISGQNMGWGEMDANGQINNSYSTPGSWGMYNYRNVPGYEQTYDSDRHYFDGYLDGETRTLTYDDLTLWNGPNGYDIVDPSDGTITPPSGCELPWITNNFTVSDNTVNYSSGAIDISCVDSVDITLDIKGEGNMETEDYINVYYKVDGGALRTIATHTDSFTTKSLEVSDINGDTIEIVIQAYTSYPGEVYTISNIKISENNTTTNGVNFQLVKRNATGFAIDGGSGAVAGRSVELYTNVQHNNLTWTEIDRGGGYYSYQKYNTNVCLDGGAGGANGQDVTLQPCNASDYGQHWQKIDAGARHYRLQKRGTNYSLDGGNGGDIDQNVYLWSSGSSNQNQHWRFDNANKNADADVKALNKIDIYPTLVSDLLTVNIPESESAWIHIANMAGQQIYSELKKGTTSVNLEHLETGVYLVKINNNGTTSITKIVKD